MGQPGLHLPHRAAVTLAHEHAEKLWHRVGSRGQRVQACVALAIGLLGVAIAWGPAVATTGADRQILGSKGGVLVFLLYVLPAAAAFWGLATLLWPDRSPDSTDSGPGNFGSYLEEQRRARAWKLALVCIILGIFHWVALTKVDGSIAW